MNWDHLLRRDNPASIGGTGPRPRVRIRQDGWIRHQGGPFPFDDRAIVEVVFEKGGMILQPYAGSAGIWPEDWWRGCPRTEGRSILFYRIVSPL